MKLYSLTGQGAGWVTPLAQKKVVVGGGGELVVPSGRLFKPAPLKAVEGVGQSLWRGPLRPLFVSSNDPGELAEAALGRTLSKDEKKAVRQAHFFGLGEVGADGTPARAYNFTHHQLVTKFRILATAGFPTGEIRTLLRRGIAGADAVDAAHHAIAHDLFNGRVVDAWPFNMNDNNTELWWVKLHNDKTGRSRKAIFKPRIWGDNEGWGRNPIEYVAYALNRMLGMDYVPPVAYRRNIEAAFQHFPEGAVTYFVPDAHVLKGVPEDQWGYDKELFLSDTRILDVLIQNSDRHKGNYIRGKHWVDGKYRAMLIDHGAGFRQGASVTMEHENAFRTGKVRKVRKRTFEALKGLNFDWLKREIGEFVSDDEIRAVLSRRDGIIRYFEARMDKHGWDNVLVDA